MRIDADEPRIKTADDPPSVTEQLFLEITRRNAKIGFVDDVFRQRGVPRQFFHDRGAVISLERVTARQGRGIFRHGPVLNFRLGFASILHQFRIELFVMCSRRGVAGQKQNEGQIIASALGDRREIQHG